MSRKIYSVLPQGARAKAQSSPPARFISNRKLGKLGQLNQNKKPFTQISLQNRPTAHANDNAHMSSIHYFGKDSRCGSMPGLGKPIGLIENCSFTAAWFI